MTTFPNSPRILKGALVGIDPDNPVPSVIVFQYNPDTLTRSIKPRAAGGDGARAEAQRLAGPPEETISGTAESPSSNSRIPDSFRRLVARLGGNNVRIEGNRMVVQNVDRSAHSEVLAIDLIKAGRKANMQLNVREIYTEYNPCTDTCLPLIQHNFPNARVTYSFVWESWGRQTPDRNAAVDALFAAQGQ